MGETRKCDFLDGENDDEVIHYQSLGYPIFKQTQVDLVKKEQWDQKASISRITIADPYRFDPWQVDDMQDLSS